LKLSGEKDVNDGFFDVKIHYNYVDFMFFRFIMTSFFDYHIN